MNSFIKCAIITITMLFTQHVVFAQPDFQNIRKLKIEMVLQNMQLTPDEEKRFLPLYNSYSDETLDLKKKIKELEKSNSDAQSKLNSKQQYKEQILLIEKKYNEKFLKIISAEQLQKMHKGEDEFRKMLLDKRAQK